MSARADLLRMLEDADRPEQELHAEVLALVAKTKMSTKDIRRVCGDFGLETTATCKQQTREQLLTSLVSKALVRARRGGGSEGRTRCRQIQGRHGKRTHKTYERTPKSRRTSGSRRPVL